MPSPLRHARKIVFSLLVFYWLTIAVGTHVPGSDLDGVSFIGDKWLHFGAYSGLAFLLSWCVMRRNPTRGTLMSVLFVALVYGCVDELTQQWVPDRSPDVRDWIVDAAGAAVGIAAYFFTWRILRNHERRREEAWLAAAAQSTTPHVHDAA